MNIAELEKWLETAEGKTWLETQKKPLIEKRDELLAKISASNASADQLNEKIAGLESNLLKANGVIREVLLSRPLAEKLKEKGVFETLIPTLSESITEAYSLQIKANGDNQETIGKIDGKETGLEQIIDAWSKTDKAKECFKPMDVKKESTSPDFKGGSPNPDKEMAALRRGAGLPEKE